MGGGLTESVGQTEGESSTQSRIKGDDEVIESTEEEVQPNKTLRTPQLPTQSELEEHRIDHLPYRSWCPECVEGFGRETAHTGQLDKARWVPVISCDYLFLSARGVFLRKEWLPMEGE